jgi:hypothetical protein
VNRREAKRKRKTEITKDDMEEEIEIKKKDEAYEEKMLTQLCL